MWFCIAVCKKVLVQAEKDTDSLLKTKLVSSTTTGAEPSNNHGNENNGGWQRFACRSRDERVDSQVVVRINVEYLR